MPDKKPTDNEIIKALEYWKEFDKEIDALIKRYPEDKADLFEQREIVRITLDALDLINRQKAEIERLTEENKKVKAYIKGNGWGLVSFLEFIKNIKAEAYKEFAERVKEKYPIIENGFREFLDSLLKERAGEDK